MTIRHTIKSSNNSSAVSVAFIDEYSWRYNEPILVWKSNWYFHPKYRHINSGYNKVPMCQGRTGLPTTYGKLFKQIEETGVF